MGRNLIGARNKIFHRYDSYLSGLIWQVASCWRCLIAYGRNRDHGSDRRHWMDRLTSFQHRQIRPIYRGDQPVDRERDIGFGRRDSHYRCGRDNTRRYLRRVPITPSVGGQKIKSRLWQKAIARQLRPWNEVRVGDQRRQGDIGLSGHQGEQGIEPAIQFLPWVRHMACNPSSRLRLGCVQRSGHAIRGLHRGLLRLAWNSHRRRGKITFLPVQDCVVRYSGPLMGEHRQAEFRQ